MRSIQLPRYMNASVLTLLAALTLPAYSARTSDPFYIIAHMANTGSSLDWAVREGANAIENDIQFDDSGNPTKFEHGGICDCTCQINSDHICGALGSSCTASEDAGAHLRYIARLPGIALVIMDGKVDAKWGSRLSTAGRNVVSLLENNLFAYGYRGMVVVSAGKINCYDYVYAAAEAASRTSHQGRYYFSFDQEGNNYHDVAAMLSRFTRNRAFGTGISSCVSGGYTSGISQAVSGVRAGQVGMSYIWTLDKESSMEEYINLGVQGILTNRVGLLRKLAESKGLRIATPEDRIPVSTSDVAQSNKCDCDYHRGGCTISSPAPVGSACRCKYKGAWTCGGSVVGCEMVKDKCAHPDASKEACSIGGGDCEGY